MAEENKDPSLAMPLPAPEEQSVEGVNLPQMVAPKPAAPLPPTGSPTQDAIGRQHLNYINEKEMTGELTPEEAIVERQRLGLSMEAQGIDADMATKESNLRLSQEAPEAADIVQRSMQDVPGLSAELPMPEPLKPTPEPDAEFEEAQRLADEAMKLSMAQQEELEAQKAMAQQKAADLAAKAAVENERAAERRVNEQDAEAARTDDGTVGGLNFRTAFAILLGGAKQGLIGGDNPALTMLDKIADKEEAKRKALVEEQKLSQEQALALEKHQLDKLKTMADIEAKKTDNNLTRMKMMELSQSIAEKQKELEIQQRMAAKGTFGVSGEEMQALPEDQRELYVRSPIDNKFYRASSRERAKQTSKNLSEIESSLPALERLREINEEVGFNIGRKIFDRAVIGEAQSLQQMAIGGLRVAIFGPGVITDNERRIAENVIRNPTKLFTIPTANRRVLNSVIKKVRMNMRIQLRNSGAKIPPSANEKKVESLMKASPKKYPNTPKGRSDAANAIIQAGEWSDE